MSDSCVVIIQNTKLAVERSVCTDIAKAVSIRHPDEEVEVRFGHTVDTKNFSGLAGSDTESSREMWYRLVALLSSSDVYVKSKVEKTLSETFGSLRKITDLGVPSAPIYQEKKRVQTIDVLTFRVGGHNHIVRLNRATEKTKVTETRGAPDYARIRTRVAFTSKDSSHRIDMTYVSPISGSSGTSAYEVEIEYLRALKDSADRADLKTFFDPIKLVMYIIKGDKELVTSLEYNQAIKVYNSLFVEEAPKIDPSKIYKRALPQPINLKSQVISRMTAYAVTNKLNGTRMIGIITGGDLYGINMVSEVTKIASGLPVILDKTVFDAEYFNGVLYVFDLLFDKGKSVRSSNLDIRLVHAQALLNLVKLDTVKMKNFKMSGDLKKDTTEMLEYIKTLPEDDNDGLIYTPITLPYFNGDIYKWKPPHMLTIDFLASRIGNGQWTLQVKNKFDKNVTFAPLGFTGNISSSKNLEGVGEYKWTGSTFELVRPRPDKDTPNFIDIAQDVWEDIQNPILEEELPELFGSSDEERDSIRKYHNSIKRDLIALLSSAEFSKGKIVLDLGAGKGGDLGKYQEARIKSLFAVEPNPEFAAEMDVRAEAMRKKHKLGYSLEVIPARAQDNTIIADAMKGKKADAATMFFSLSFFFENNLSLIELVRTLNESVEKGGMFIGTTIDGEAVRRALEGKTEINFGPVTIRKQYSDFKGPIEFGKAIDYIYKNSETVIDTQREYLVDWELFASRVIKQGFELVSSSLFAPTSWLTEDENKVSSLYRSFVFKRFEYGTKEQPFRTGPPPKHIPMRQAGTTATIKSTLTAELEEKKLEYNLVRTGVWGDGNCFFHSVLVAARNTEYRSLSEAGQKRMAIEYRKSLNLTKAEWEKIWNGSFARIGQAEYPGFDTRFWNYLTDDISGFMSRRNDIETAVGQYGIKNFLQELGSRKYSNLSLTSFIIEIKKVFPTFIKNPSSRVKAIKQLDEIIDRSSNEAYTSFINLVKTCGEWVGQEVLEIVSDSLDRDIYILHDIDGAPYPTECKHVKGRKSIILLFQGGNHYECVGRLLPNKSIQREFESDDPIIKLIQEKVC
jgi:SAM-dependent methyltransferase